MRGEITEALKYLEYAVKQLGYMTSGNVAHQKNVMLSALADVKRLLIAAQDNNASEQSAMSANQQGVQADGASAAKIVHAFVLELDKLSGYQRETIIAALRTALKSGSAA